MLEERKKQEARGGLIEFIRYFWDILEPQTGMVDGWPLEAICGHLEAITYQELQPPRLLENVPPGFMKSLITNVFWPAWEWGPMNLPHLRYLSFSYTAILTHRDNRRFLALLESRKYQELYGDRFKLVKIGEELVSNDKTGWKLASSVGGVGTGERGNRVLVDDPHNVREQESVKIRDGTVQWFQESIQNRLNDLQKDAIIVIMQRVHEGDVSGAITRTMPEYTHLCIPWEYEPGRHCETSIGWSDPRTEEGEPAWPERFPESTMETFRRIPYLWAGQYQQRPAPRGGGILKSDWWQIWDKTEANKYGLEWNDEKGKLKEFPPFDLVVASLDSAYGKKKENDYSALTIWGCFTDRNRNRRWMLMYAWHDRLEFHDLVERVAKDCRRYNVTRLLIEGKASGISVEQEIRRAYAREQFGVQLINPGSLDKEARAHSIVYLFTDKMVWAPDPEVIDWAGDVIDECAAFPRGMHDDYVDSVTQALGWLRLAGLAERRDERTAADEDMMTHRPRRQQPLYPGMG